MDTLNEAIVRRNHASWQAREATLLAREYLKDAASEAMNNPHASMLLSEMANACQNLADAAIATYNVESQRIRQIQRKSA